MVFSKPLTTQWPHSLPKWKELQHAIKGRWIIVFRLNCGACKSPYCVFQIMRKESYLISLQFEGFFFFLSCLFWFASNHQDYNAFVAVVLSPAAFWCKTMSCWTSRIRLTLKQDKTIRCHSYMHNCTQSVQQQSHALSSGILQEYKSCTFQRWAWEK